MTDLKPCSRCCRHVAIGEHACPFCGAGLDAMAPQRVVLGRASRAVVFASAALASTACGGKQMKPDPNTQNQQISTVDAGTMPAPEPREVVPADPAPAKMPYGAPPARRRIV
jgi:hypothetical protein